MNAFAYPSRWLRRRPGAGRLEGAGDAAWSGVPIRTVASGQQGPALGSRLTVRAVVELGLVVWALA